MSRKILLSPGFGAGWASWADREHRAFALEYRPIIEYLEGGGEFEALPWEPNRSGPDGYEEPGASVLRQFLADLAAHAGTDATHFYLGGADQLEVVTVDGPIQLHEYDGSESIDVPDSVEWL